MLRKEAVRFRRHERALVASSALADSMIGSDGSIHSFPITELHGKGEGAKAATGSYLKDREQATAPGVVSLSQDDSSIQPENDHDDVQPLFGKFAARARMVCAISVPHSTVRGTGFLIGPDLVVTCDHVIRRARNGLASEVQVIFDREARRDRSGHQPGLSYRLKPGDEFGTFSEEADLDYAILKIDGRPGDDARGGPGRGWVNLRDDADVRRGTFIAIIHHPEDTRLLFSPGVIDSSAEQRLVHTARTFFGSSGGAVFDLFGRVVAMHTGNQTSQSTREALPISKLRERILALGIESIQASLELDDEG